MHYRYYSTKLQVFQEYLAPRRVLVYIQVGVASLYKKARSFSATSLSHQRKLHRQKKHHPTRWCKTRSAAYGNFAFGEYLLALRLASKLADLRAANANP